MPRHRNTPPPLDDASLERLALRYVERFATTRAKLARYLARKLLERGWAGGPAADPAALSERMAALGYIDDRGYARAKADAMTRRGLGARRIRQTLAAAGVETEDRPAADDGDAAAAALAFARRRRIGPFAPATPDREQRERQIAQLLRAGHSYDLARRLVAMRPGDEDEVGWTD